MNLNTERQNEQAVPVITDALKSLLFSTWGTDTFQRQHKAISAGTPPPQMTLKRRCSSPCLLWRSLEALRLSEEKGGRIITC